MKSNGMTSANSCDPSGSAGVPGNEGKNSLTRSHGHERTTTATPGYNSAAALSRPLRFSLNGMGWAGILLESWALCLSIITAQNPLLPILMVLPRPTEARKENKIYANTWIYR
jgi:hypothetical protein